ncbi:hypothetical protein DAPPUDRAFT_315117 [Daphnia pulex]|uniref:Uncharacterized protein n=1 Tax=Daphnia pulex TaxID=6669 RepID=E9G8S9_DAPPU|nr:hypothetical protein DAPPUDRAFT_315117 [Daphnia pulex]|eukprot:EFX84025.1 hypothetical protein DAPPUDRAFT_315117 [Daphnia pulex]
MHSNAVENPQNNPPASRTLKANKLIQTYIQIDLMGQDSFVENYLLTQLNEKDGVEVRPLPVKDPIDDTGMATPGRHSERGDGVNDDSSNEILISVIFAPLISCQWRCATSTTAFEML